MHTFLEKFQDNLRVGWLSMIELPWQHTGPEGDRVARREHWLAWLIGWAWALSGLALGALLAPWLLQIAGLSGTSSTDSLAIAIAVVMGFLVQVLGTVVVSLWNTVVRQYSDDWSFPLAMFLLVTQFIVVLLPLAGVGFGIYRYLNWVGAGQRTITIAFAGALLIKTFVIPAITGAIRSKAFQIFLQWLRRGSGKDTRTA